MTRFCERARSASVLSVVLVSCVVLGSVATLAGCEQLDGRNRTRQGNKLFRETQFVDAAAEYQHALKQVDDPIIHYNLGLAYSKVFKPGYDGPVLLGTASEPLCGLIPNTKPVQTGACVKEGDRHFAECGAGKSAPIEKAIAELQTQLKAETDDAKKKDVEQQIKDKQDELNRYICAASYHCVEGNFCSLTSPEIAQLAAEHFQVWIKAQPSDDELKSKQVQAQKDLAEAQKTDNKSLQATAQKVVDDLSLKDQTRKLMTQMWMDSDDYGKALEYWEGLLKDKPNDSEIMSTLAGINSKKGDWRKSIEWYNKVADVTTDANSKVTTLQFIGNAAWAKLNTRTLIGAEQVELADRGIGALQRAAEIQPQNFRLISLQGSLYNFRSTAHGASIAGAVDRATTTDLQKRARVLSDEAKKAQGLPVSPPDAPPTGAGSGSAAGSAAGSNAGSAAPANKPAAPAAGSAAPASTNPPAPAGGGSASQSG